MTQRTVVPFGRTAIIESRLSVIDCASCGQMFAIGVEFEKRRREDRATFYCPNGHSLSFHGPSEVERERDRLKRELEWAETSRKSWRDQAEAAERRRIAQKGVTTKLKKRIAAGVCPCCQRTFQNLGRHMSGQHPDFTVEAES